MEITTEWMESLRHVDQRYAQYGSAALLPQAVLDQRQQSFLRIIESLEGGMKGPDCIERPPDNSHWMCVFPPGLPYRVVDSQGKVSHEMVNSDHESMSTFPASGVLAVGHHILYVELVREADDIGPTGVAFNLGPFVRSSASTKEAHHKARALSLMTEMFGIIDEINPAEPCIPLPGGTSIANVDRAVLQRRMMGAMGAIPMSGVSGSLPSVPDSGYL
ncbi:MAG: hypothetical protein AAF413_04105 [Patescibacteria group bacterium]